MADFPLYDGSVFEAIGVDTSDSKGVTLTSGASAHTKGSWVELTSSAPEGITSFMVMLYNTNEGTGSSRISIDIGLGTAPEVVLVPDLRSNIRVQHTVTQFMIPMAIPGGVRVAARSQSGTAGSITCDVALCVFRGGFLSSPALTQATHYGFTTASTTGTQMDPGATINTKGAASEITAATTNQIRSMMLMIGNGTQSNPPTRPSCTTGYLLDIGVGSTPDYIINNLPFSVMTATDGVHPNPIGPFDCCIPSGTRIVARAQSNDNTATIRTFDLSILGFN